MTYNWLEVLEKPIKVLKVIGLWIDKDTPTYRIVLSLLAHMLCVELLTISETIYVIKARSLSEFLSVFVFVPTHLCACLKALNFVTKKDKIEKFLKESQEVFDEIDQIAWISNQSESKLKKLISRIDKIFKALLVGSTAVMSANFVVSFINHELPLVMWYPYNPFYSELNFWSTAAYQAIAAPIYYVVTTILEAFPFFFMSFITGMLQELCDRLDLIGSVKKFTRNEPGTSSNKFKKSPNDGKNLKKLLKIVKSHNKLKALTSDIEAIFANIVCFQGVLSAFVLCTTSFLLTTVKDQAILSTLIGYMIAMTFQIFLPCYFGNQLLSTSEKLSSSLFHSNWTKQSKEFKQAMKIFMENTKKPMKVSGLGIFEVNLENFLKVVNAAYSLYAVLENFKN